MLLAFTLILGTWALLFHKEKLSALPEILTWLQRNSPGDVMITMSSPSPRANIYDRNFRPLATTYETYALYARPLEMENPGAAATQLEQILHLTPNKLLADLKSERGFVWIAKGIDKELADTIKNQNIKGIYQVVETKRFYPHAESAAHAVGFVENDQGLDGVEFHYNALLRGADISGAELQKMHFRPAAELGSGTTHLVLNLDLMLQTKIERFLEKRVKATGAASGAVMLMEAGSGNVLAMVSYPPFNPNRYWEFSSNALNNNLVSQAVYPGELALIFQQAAAINLKNDTKTDGISNADTRQPLLTLEPRLLKRRRFAVAPPVDTVAPEYLSYFAKLLGFDQKPMTDIPLKDETDATETLALNDPSFHTSALRLLTGFTSLVNGGRRVTPRLLHVAYPKDNPNPVEPIFADNTLTVPLHPSTGPQLVDFLADKWFKKRPAAGGSMFLETHRYVVHHATSEQAPAKNNTPANSEPTPRITQTVMLGAIPAKDPRLTMVAFLNYPDSSDEAYPDILETFGNRFSILSPDSDMIQKMIYVAQQSPPVPSPDFWTADATLTASVLSPVQPKQNDSMTADDDSLKLMPDVTGKSLRAGLQTLQYFNLDISLRGSGMIVSQHPAAGTQLKNNGECILKLRREI